MTLDLKPAFQIAVDVHGEQKDKGGDDYLWHVFRVGMAGHAPDEQVVGLLHDVLEDLPERQGPPSMESVHAFGRMAVRIQNLYGWEIYEAVVALTRGKNETYADYLERLSSNPLAVKTKFSDLNDNMRTDRLEKLPAEDRVRLLLKYQEAYKFLSDRVSCAGTPVEQDGKHE